MVERYRQGSTAKTVAEDFRVSLSSKRLMRERGQARGRAATVERAARAGQPKRVVITVCDVICLG